MPDAVHFAVLLDGAPVGMTSYLEIRPAQFGLEIGMTWYGRAHQGTLVNPEAKFLLMEHAFERFACERVQLKTDSENAQSRRAIEKLGGQFEGILRRHRRYPDGKVRDTAMYSVIREEWPAVRDGLQSRLQLVG